VAARILSQETCLPVLPPLDDGKVHGLDGLWTFTFSQIH
jgi:hypothetical protein